MEHETSHPEFKIDYLRAFIDRYEGLMSDKDMSLDDRKQVYSELFAKEYDEFKAKQVKAVLPPPVASYILNKKRSEILDIESKRHVEVIIESDRDIIPGKSIIECIN